MREPEEESEGPTAEETAGTSGPRSRSEAEVKWGTGLKFREVGVGDRTGDI